MMWNMRYNLNELDGNGRGIQAFTVETTIDGHFGSGPHIYDSNSNWYALGYVIGVYRYVSSVSVSVEGVSMVSMEAYRLILVNITVSKCVSTSIELYHCNTEFSLLNDILKKHGAEGEEVLGQAQFAQLLQPVLQELADALAGKHVVVTQNIKIINRF
ncbi:hypothetical protein HHK36_012721 [Tetracentron sinense]|uniref:Uncharacterized protein n=1 Tax=Tetracentron sinense TaxID=13715 RepID=A0A834Z987_TETSI|nr:hypothetical protein HHK36_012721 [Tetracentron sinense]